MTDNETITDEQLIIALEEHIRLRNLGICEPDTPLHMLILLLDLINDQKAQIKQLENIERFATKTIEKQEAEIERLNVELVGMRGACESYKMHYDNAQVEIDELQKLLDLSNKLLDKKQKEMEGETVWNYVKINVKYLEADIVNRTTNIYPVSNAVLDATGEFLHFGGN